MEFRTDVTLGMNRTLDPPLMNGGGCCKTTEDVKELSRSLAGAIVLGSITLKPSTGNEGNVWWYKNGIGLNALGMPNGGKRYLEAHGKEMAAIAHDAGKAFIVNIAGSSPPEYSTLAQIAFEQNADAIEVNLACPNIVREDGSRKPIASLDMQVMGEILFQMHFFIPKEKAVWIKVSPHSDPELLKHAAGIISGYDMVKALTGINTFPSAFGFNEKGGPTITVGYAGLSGSPLKHIGLGQIKQWRAALPKRISIIAVGGISHGIDIDDYRKVGADAFQMTTELLKHGKLDASPFERVAFDYDAL